MSDPNVLPGKQRYTDKATLFSGAVTPTVGTNGTAMELPGGMRALGVMLDVTAAATTAGDTLDVYIRTLIDGTNWVDVHHFTQVLGNGSAKQYYAAMPTSAALTEFEDGTGLGEHTSRGMAGTLWRVHYVVVNDSTAGFTFSVTAVPM